MIRSIQLAGLACLLTAFLSPSAEAVLTHYWNFEEPDGTAAPQVKDTAGTRHGNFGGTLSDANRSPDVPSFTGSTRSLNFGSPNTINYVDVYTPSASYLDMPSTNNWTVSLWYRGTEAGGVDTSDDSGLSSRVILGSTAGHANLEFALGGKVVYSHYTGTYQYNVISSVSVNDDVWHNITLVNHDNQTADLYVDAVAQVTGASSTISTLVPWKIGAFMTGPGTAGNFTSGKLDEVRIFDSALTAAEVLDLLDVPEPSTIGLLAIGGGLLWKRRRLKA